MFVPNIICLRFGDDLTLYEFVLIEIVDILPVADDFVHHGLRESRLILLIVPISSVSDDIHKNIFFELLSVLHCYSHGLVH